MKLFKYENYEVKIAPEALLLTPFKKIWSRDKSNKKSKAIQEFSFIYFYCDPRSDFQYIVDDNDRLEAVKESIGLEKNWKPDSILNKAIDFYSSFDSASAKLIRMANAGVQKVQNLLQTLQPDDTKSLKEYLVVMKMIPEVATMLNDVERKLNEEMDYGESSGAMEKTVCDDGLDAFMS